MRICYAVIVGGVAVVGVFVVAAVATDADCCTVGYVHIVIVVGGVVGHVIHIYDVDDTTSVTGCLMFAGCVVVVVVVGGIGYDEVGVAMLVLLVGVSSLVLCVAVCYSYVNVAVVVVGVVIALLCACMSRCVLWLMYS